MALLYTGTIPCARDYCSTVRLSSREGQHGLRTIFKGEKPVNRRLTALPGHCLDLYACHHFQISAWCHLPQTTEIAS